MFVPALDQEAINKRASDIDDLKKQHVRFVKLMEVKIRMLENDNIRLQSDVSVIRETQKNMRIDFEKTKTFLTSTQVILSELSQKIESVGLGLNDLVNRKLNLAAKITAAQKRLDESGM